MPATPVAPDETVTLLGVPSALKLWLINQEERGLLSRKRALELWNEWKIFPGKAAAYSSTAQDIAMLRKIAKDFGSYGAKVYVKQYANKAPVIILKGYAGVRKILTATKYGLEHPKIISMRIDYRGAAASVREGGVLTLILVSAFDVADYFLIDKVTIADLVGQLASDFIKAAVATGVTILALAALSGTVISAVAIGPLLAAVAIGVGVGLALDALDKKMGLTDALKKALNGLVEQAADRLKEAQQDLLDMAEAAVKAIIVNAVAGVEI